MAFSKQHLYDPNDQITSQFFKALNYPARLLILRQLHEKDEICVQEMAEKHPLSDEAFSEHLKILRIMHFVHGRESFPYTFYSMQENNVEKARDFMISYFKEILG